MSTQAAKKTSIWSVPFIILMMVNFFQSMAAFMAIATMPLYASALGAAPGLVGIVVGSFAFSAILCRPFAGPAFDAFPRKTLLIICLALICLSMFLYSLVTDLRLLVAIRLLHGIGVGCSGPLAMSLISEFLPPAKLSSGISIYTLAQSVAQVIGPAVGLFLVESVGFMPTFCISGISLLIAVAGVCFIKEPPRELLKYELKLDRMFAKEAVPMCIALMLLSMSFSCVGSYIVLYGYSMDVSGLGLYFTVYACCLLITRPVFGTLADKFGAPRLLFFGIFSFASSYIALSLTQDFWGFMLAAVLGSAGFGACAPLIQSLSLSSVPPERRGTASNTTFTGLDIGMLVGPIIGGYIVEMLTGSIGLTAAYSQMWLFMLIPPIGTMGIIIYWNIKLDRKKKAEKQR